LSWIDSILFYTESRLLCYIFAVFTLAESLEI